VRISTSGRIYSGCRWHLLLGFALVVDHFGIDLSSDLVNHGLLLLNPHPLSEKLTSLERHLLVLKLSPVNLSSTCR